MPGDQENVAASFSTADVSNSRQHSLNLCSFTFHSLHACAPKRIHGRSLHLKSNGVTPLGTCPPHKTGIDDVVHTPRCYIRTRIFLLISFPRTSAPVRYEGIDPCPWVSVDEARFPVAGLPSLSFIWLHWVESCLCPSLRRDLIPRLSAIAALYCQPHNAPLPRPACLSFPNLLGCSGESRPGGPAQHNEYQYQLDDFSHFNSGTFHSICHLSLYMIIMPHRAS